MKQLNKITRSLKLALMVGSTLSAQQVLAQQEQNAQDNGADDVEVIQVSGIRASQKKAINAKRFANAVVDAVSAEDIGKFPDSDVGEALGRIPGVAVNRQFGQGQQVSIRGASNQLTRTLLNGHSIASTGWYDQQPIDRSFNYTLLPPELVGEIEVYKSSKADLPEGGIGGTIIVNTRKPMDLDANTVFASAKADYGTASESTDPEFSGLYSWKNESESFGILASASLSSVDYQRDGLESLIGWGEISVNTFQQERERSAFNVTAQFRPSDRLELGVNLTSLDMTADNANTSLYVIFPDDKEAACEQQSPAGACTFWRRPTGDANPGWAQTWARAAEMSSETYDFDFKYEGDNFTAEGRLGHTEAEGGTNLTANYGFFLGNPDDYAGTYDATGDKIVIDVNNKHFGPEDFQGDLASAGWAMHHEPNSDEETYAQFDLSFPTDLGPIQNVKTGLRWADHEVAKVDHIANIVEGGIQSRPATDFYEGTVPSAAGYILPEPKLDVMIEDTLSYIDSWNDQNANYKSSFGTIEEENLSLYAMAEFDVSGIRGNFGLRYISTDAESDYYDLNADGTYANALSTRKADYDDILPSINIAFDVAQDVILRASAAQVISRPNYTDMFESRSLSGYEDGTPGNEVQGRGNVALMPFLASQADVSLEWYFSEDGLASATFFVKDVSSFITSEQIRQQQIGIESPDLQGNLPDGCATADCWTVSTLTNGTGGEIKGLELQLQDAYDNGFGYSLNYTYADATAPAENYPDRIPMFSDSSEHTVNTVGYYEKDAFSARVAYNWRSEYMIRELPGFYGNRQHEDFGTLDFSASYDVNDNIEVTFEAVNITEEDSIQIGVAPTDAPVKPELKNNFPAWSFEGEARYKVGVNLRF